MGGGVGGSVYACARLCLWRCVYIKDLGVPKYLKKKIHFLFNKKHGAKASMTCAKSRNVIFVIRVCSVSGICHNLIQLKSYLEKLSSQRNLGTPLPFPGFQGAILICDLLSP